MKRVEANGESRGAEVLTIFWTVLVTTAVGCNIGAAVTRLIHSNQPGNNAIGLLSGLLLFAAVVVGVLILGLLPVVYRMRKEPPPRGYVVFAVLIGAAPILTVIALAMR